MPPRVSMWFSVSIAQFNLIIMFSSLTAALPVCHLWTCHLCRSRTYDMWMPGMASSNGRKHGATQDLPLFFCFRRQRSQICRKYSPCFYSWCSAGTRRATVFGSSLTSVSLLDMKSQCGICYLKARRMGAGPCLVECTCGQVLLHQQPNFPMQQWHKHIQATGTPRAGQATATPRAGQATATLRAVQPAATLLRADPCRGHAEGRQSQDLAVTWRKHPLRWLQVLFHSLLFQNIKILWKVCWNKNQITDSGIY